MTDTDQWPDGIDDAHTRSEGLGRHANPLALVLLGFVLLLALLGFAGKEVDRSASGNGVTLSWHAPERIRNGELLEMRITVVAGTRPIEALVLGVDASLWEDLTINTVIPAPAEESSLDGEFRFDFGPVESGSSLLVKVDGQVNPDILGGNQGSVTAYDGEEALVELPLKIEVLP